MARRSDKPYVHFARVYDHIMADVPYHFWMDYIAKVWATYSFSPSTVLDLACGTGSMSLLLARQGRQVTGVDASDAMLDVARQKLKAEGLYAEFARADMRVFTLKDPVDAAISVFDSLNYLLTPAAVKATFCSVARALKSQGMFVFDVNTPERLAAIPKEVHLFEGPDHFLIWSDLYEPSKQWWKVKLTGFLRKPRGGEGTGDTGIADPLDDDWIRFDETHRERAFPISDITEWLKAAGFDVLGVHDSCSFRPATKATSRAYFVARKR